MPLGRKPQLCQREFPQPLEQYKFWETNLLQSIAMVKTIPEGNLYLRMWLLGDHKPITEKDINDGASYHTCGSVACFGGWMTGWPYFKAIGIRPCSVGSPEIPHLSIRNSDLVSDLLFGVSGMFYPRRNALFSSDKDELMHRLTTRLVEVESLILEEAKYRTTGNPFRLGV